MEEKKERENREKRGKRHEKIILFRDNNECGRRERTE